ncbi:MAG: PadR family transcriptional regulator [Bryobacteraceae bacterium]
MPRRVCRRHGGDQLCTCAMGNLSRFVEPVVLLLIKKKRSAYGYDLAADLEHYALTDAEIERGALYRTLRQLEMNGNVVSEWEVAASGPARRIYRLTPQGERHLKEWAVVLEHLAFAMNRFVKDAAKELAAGTNPPRQPNRPKRDLSRLNDPT